MGCECCKVMTPSQYERCQELDEKLTAARKSRIAPCGGTDIGLVTPHGGSNYTPPKKKRKKKRK